MARARNLFFGQRQPILRFLQKRIHPQHQRSLLKLLGAIVAAILVCFCSVLSPNLTDTLTAAPSGALIEQGLQQYQAEQFDAAIALFRQVIESSSNGSLVQAQAFSYLALCYQKQGNLVEAEKAIAQSLAILENQQPQKQSENLAALAQALNTRGQLQFSQGDAATAFKTWQRATTIYQRLGNTTGIIGSTLNQTQALQAMGLLRQAEASLKQLVKQIETQPDSALKATVLRSYGNVLRVTGEFDRSIQTLEQSQAISERLNQPQAQAETLLGLGNSLQAFAREQLSTASSREAQYEAQKTLQRSLTFYEQAATITLSPTTRIQANLNRFNALLEDEDEWENAQQLWRQLQPQIDRLPLSRANVYAQINLVEALLRPRKILPEALETESEVIAQQVPPGTRTADSSEPVRTIPSETQIIAAQQPGFPTLNQTLQIAEVTLSQAKALGDRRAESYALGGIGKVYRQMKQFDAAQQFTQQALQVAQALNASDISYRWLWQAGQLFRNTGKTEKAIVAYREAIKTLRSLRNDLAVINPEVQFTFRDGVEPVYREFVSLLVQVENQSGTFKSKSVNQQLPLEEAREVIESLQLAELDNFLRKACLEGDQVTIDTIDPTAAVIYPVILPQQLSIIVSLPGQPATSKTISVSSEDLELKLYQLRSNLLNTDGQFLETSQQVYQWLIAPFETQLQASGVKTLAFVLDGGLRTIPMAALHDGQQFLIEKYNIALTPGLRLVSTKPLQRQQLSVIIGALSERSQKHPEFPPLTEVKNEVAAIQAQIPRSQVLLDSQFTTRDFDTALRNFTGQIVHLATHGNFSSVRSNTFLVTQDDALTLDELSSSLRSQRATPIDLLVLSACQTAEGDNRATLGLAGVAIQAGVRSTIGSLWSVNDKATAELMSQFYKELTSSTVSKAEALRKAQLAMLKKGDRTHPFYWAPFVLIGSWL